VRARVYVCVRSDVCARDTVGYVRGYVRIRSIHTRMRAHARTQLKMRSSTYFPPTISQRYLMTLTNVTDDRREIQRVIGVTRSPILVWHELTSLCQSLINNKLPYIVASRVLSALPRSI